MKKVMSQGEFDKLTSATHLEYGMDEAYEDYAKWLEETGGLETKDILNCSISEPSKNVYRRLLNAQKKYLQALFY